LELAPGLNVFVGPNGAGKSNLLEAVSILCTSQSHRGADAKHLFQTGKDEMLLRGKFDDPTEPEEMEVRQKAGRPRQFVLNGRPQKRLRDWLGRTPLVSFSPDDLDLVKGEPSIRRRALNAVLCQVDPDYLESLQRYNKILAERNAALRQVAEGENREIVEPWTTSLLQEGVFLTLARRAFIAPFADGVRRRHAALASKPETVGLSYRPSFLLPSEDAEAVTAANRRRLTELREAEIAVGSTLVGPHRDDLDISLDGSPARDYASQGQQRTLSLAVKLAEGDFLQEKLGRAPVSLFDDVLSELDPDRKENLVSALSRHSQSLVSLTSLAEADGLLDRQPQIFDVADGAVRARTAA